MTRHPVSFALQDGAAGDLLAAAGAGAPGPARRARQAYLDTFDWRLAGRGLCLRAVDGARVELVDLKTGAVKGAAERDFLGGFIGDLPEALRGAVAPAVEMRRLMPRLQVRIVARGAAVRDDEGKVVVRLSAETWACRAGGTPAHKAVRVVAEPVKGYGAAFDAVAGRLGGEGLDFGGWFRAVCAGAGDPVAPSGGKLRLGLKPRMTAGEAARAIHLVLLDAMEENEAGAAANVDSEFLHDFRVAVRRTRSALGEVDRNVLPDEAVARAKADFRWLGRQTNRMRDLDVYLLDVPAFEAALPEDYRAALEPFRAWLEGESRRENRRVARMLRGRRYSHVKAHWRGFLEEAPLADGKLAGLPARELAGRRVWKIYRLLMAEGSAIGDASPAEALHELRITAKKLRYLLEFFRELYPAKKVAGLVKALKVLQDVLGRFQDSEVQSARIADFAREMAAAGDVPVETQMAMGMVAESILVRRAEARAAFHDAFVRFAADEVEATFRELFKEAKQ